MRKFTETVFCRFAILIAACCAIDAKVLTCDEYLDEPVLHDEFVYSHKCTFSYIVFGAFDEVNVSSTIVKEIDYDNQLGEVDVSGIIESVEFLSSRFPRLPREMFVRFRNLKSVTCDGASMESLSSADFQMATNLVAFSCNSNYIKSLEKQLFEGSSKLQSLDLSINEIDDIDGTTFAGLSSLKKLMLYDNKLKTLPKDIFSGLSSLEEINLSSNQLRIVDDDLFANCKRLNYIYLNDNRIEQISDKSLSTIDEIKFLELSRNELARISMNISASALYANHNRLKSVRLNSVGYLSFFNNSITELEFVDKLGVLSLNVSTNELNASSLGSIGELGGLKSVDLSFNPLGALDVKALLGMPKLQILNLQSTNLGEIGYGLFTHQTGLEQLDLSYNGMNALDLPKLTPLKALTTLFIEGNNITEIDYKAIGTYLPALKLFGFSDNPWTCAYLSSLIAHLGRSGIEVYQLVTEKTKSNVAGIACSETKANEQLSYGDKSLSVNVIKHHQLSGDGNELKAISERFEEVARHVNETGRKFVTKVELINELDMIKSVVASLKQDMLDVRKRNATVNSSGLQKQSDYELRINGLNVSIESLAQELDEIKIQLKLLSFKSSATAATQRHTEDTPTAAASTSDDVLTKLMITLIFVIVCGFAIIYIIRLYAIQRARRFVVRRAHSETDTLNENIL